MTSQAPAQPLVRALHDPQAAMQVGRQLLQNLHQQQWERFKARTPIQHLLSERTNFIDQLLRRVWKHQLPTDTPLSLIAVGGYGRGELHPHSDIDILILTTAEQIRRQDMRAIEQFITYLWDIGLQVGHAIRTLDDCHQLGREDLSTATNFVEARWLIGNYEGFDALRNLWKRRDFWSSTDFFLGKLTEQQQRHSKAMDALAQLEPNLKESPGGLRDLHTIAWVAKRHFGASSLQQLVTVGFLTVEEYTALERAMRFHWRVRFVLHSLKNRKEERLLFDHQKLIAQELGYQDQTGCLAVEAFMQDYYRNASTIRRMNALLLQHFREELLTSATPQVTELDQDFIAIDGYLRARDEQVFIRNPLNLLRIFLLVQQHPWLHGIRARTQRLMLSYVHLINDAQCHQAETWDLLREILRQPHGVTRALRAMHSQGILGRLLPAFGRITGLMQFDLFHAYTVDEHTLMVIRNLRRFLSADNHSRQDFSLACELAGQLEKPDLLLLAGLFHDIAKGRGGDHSILGAQDALGFAQQAGLSETDGQLLGWLVREHLLMSHTAQKQDISDPEVIATFALRVGNINALNHLYLLTVADICATSPVVWNGWKDNLLRDLYRRTQRALTHQTSLAEDYDQACQLALSGTTPDTHARIKRIWHSLSCSDYRTRHNQDDLHRHAQLLASSQQLPALHLQHSAARGVCALGIYAADTPDLWLRVTAVCDAERLNIVDAQLFITCDGFSLIDLKFLQPDNWDDTQHTWLMTLRHSLTSSHLPDSPSQPRLSARQRHFSVTPRIHFDQDSHAQHTELLLTVQDKPGLLFECARIFHRHQLRLKAAKISTVGARAEDVFFLTDMKGHAIAPQGHRLLERDLLAALQGNS